MNPWERSRKSYPALIFTTDKISENIAGRKLIRIQEIVASPDITEDRISESIAEMEKIFTRISAMHGAIESLPSEEQKDMIKRVISAGGRMDREGNSRHAWLTKKYAAGCKYFFKTSSAMDSLQKQILL